MPTLVQTILDGAQARSAANNPGFNATPLELVGELNRLVKGLYRRAAKTNPAYFGAALNVTPSLGAWTRPPLAITVFHVEAVTGGASSVLVAGTRVNIVELKDRLSAAVPPRIYRLGQVYLSPLEMGDPATEDDGDVLRFYYAMRHPEITLQSGLLDASWVADHDELLIMQLGLYLAMKDKMRGDSEGFADVVKSLLEKFDEDVASTDAAMVSRFERPHGFTDPGLKNPNA